MEFTVEHDGEESRFVPIKSSSVVPYEFLRTELGPGSWSAPPWKPFLSSKHEIDKQSALFCKVFEPNRKTSQITLVKHVANDVWTCCKVDKNVKLKDIKALPDNVPVKWTSLETCSTIPDWTHRSLAELNLDPPTPTDMEIKNKHQNHQLQYKQDPPALPPVPDLKNPVALLQYKYYELLYVNQSLPLVHFAKSTLARLRSIFRENAASSEVPQQYKSSLIDCLQKVVLKAPQWDVRYDITAVSRFLKGDAHPCTKCDLESTYLDYWRSQVRGDVKSSLEQVKVRELQLQVIVLLELLATTATNKNQKQELEQSQSQEVRKPKASLVRKSKKRSQSSLQPIVDKEPELQPDILVDLAFDRLCIWQTLHAKDKSSDIPYELCRDVLIPYYGKKLASKTKILAKKATGSGNKVKRDNPKSSQSKDSTTATDTTTAATTSHHSKSLKQSIVQSKQNSTAEKSNSIESNESGATNSTTTTTTTTTDDNGNSKFHIGAARAASILKSHNKRQVEMTAKLIKPAAKKKQPTAEELADAIRNISKPNRVSVAQELYNSRPQKKHSAAGSEADATAASKSVLQVAAADTLVTPSMNRKRYQQVEFTTPIKKFKLGGNAGGGGLENSAAIEDSDDEVIKSTPIKSSVDAVMGHDTDED